MSFILIFLILVAFVFVLYLYLAFAEKILRPNQVEAKEAQKLIGSFGRFWQGQLKLHPNQFGDYRVTRGLAINKKKHKISLQSTLSTEKFRAIYNR